MLSKKFESNTQDPPFASLDMNLVTMESNNEPEKANPTLVKKSFSEVKVLDNPEKKNEDIVLNLKKELIYKRDLEVKQRFPKGKFIVAYEPSKKQDFYVMRLKECLNIKRKVAWVDFYDLTTKNDDYWEFTKDKEGIVQWDNMIALLNVKVKPKEEVHAVKLLTAGPLLDKIDKFMGKKKNKRDRKRLEKQEENKEDSDSDYDDSDSDADTVNLLPGSKKEEAKQIAAPAKKKFFKRVKKSTGQKKAEEEKKRKDAENKDRRIHIELEESGIRIIKTRNINDTDKEEIVEVDPTLKEIRPKKWKVVEREEENKEAEIIDEERMRFSADSNLIYLEDSSTTANRNIIRACLTDNADLAKLCINEKQLITSLMESWSPEIKSTAIELCITNNSRKVLLLLLDVCKEEEEKVRANPNREHLKKFDTGQVDERAFGTRVRKVEMMRGGRQGNNAFMQDVRRNDEYKTILQQLNEDEILAVRAAYSCNVERETLRLIYEELKDQAAPFFKQIFFHILRTGRRHLAAECLEILQRIGDAETKEQITDEMIEVLQLEDDKIDISKLDPKHKFEGVNYLHLAFINPNCLDLVQRLLRKEFNMGMKDKIGATPIFYAAVNPNTQFLEFILEDEDQYLRVYDQKMNTPLIMAIIARRIENIHFIIQNVPTAVKDKSILRLTPLSVACRNGHVGTMRTLMSYAGSPCNQAGGWEKMTPLCYASSYGYLDLVEYLLTFTKAKIDKGDKFGRTPLMLACRNGHAKIASTLLKYGADTKAQDTSGNCALHYAAAYGFPECVDLVLENANAQNLWKSTPLSIALMKRNLVCVNQLLDKAGTINANVKDDNGNTLLNIAIESMNESNFDMIKKIIKGSKPQLADGEESITGDTHGADPNIPDADGNTPLIKVIQKLVEKRKKKQPYRLELKVAKLLLENDADPGKKNKAGQSAITMVMQTGGYSNTMDKDDGISKLIQMLWKGFSFLNSPESFFSFNKSILSPDTQAMIITFIEKSIKEINATKEEDKEKKEEEDVEMSDEEEKIETTTPGALPKKIINTLDDEGYTPFLRYINQFTTEGRRILQRIEREIIRLNITDAKDFSKVDMSAMMKDQQTNNVFGGGFGGANIFGGFNNQPSNHQKKLALQLFDENITKPFTKFLQQLIDFGANQHATVDKLKDYREEIGANGLKFRKRDSYGKIRNEYSDTGLSNALHLILEFPSQTLFDFILDSNVSTEEINIKKMTPFFMLIKTKDTTLPEYKHCLDKFINSKSDIDSPDQFGISAFWYCYQNQKVDLAFYLASKGADVNRLDNYGFFALKTEVFNNNLDRVRRLLDVGAEINKKDEFQRTVLHHAYNRYRPGNDLGIIKYLINKGANINEKDFKDRTPLHYLFVKSNRRFNHDPSDPSDALVEAINLGVPITLNEPDKKGNTVLHYICQRCSIECLKMLKAYAKPKDFEITNQDGNTPLAVALNFMHVSIITYIINNFDIDLHGYVFRLHKDQSQLGNNVQGEESDFEFMFTQEVKEDKEKEAEKLLGRKSYFEYCVLKPELNNVAKLLLNKGYSITRAFKDAFKVGNYQQLFQLLNNMDPISVKNAVNMKDDSGRGIFHSLSKAPSDSAFDSICKTLIDKYNLDPNDTDAEGNTPIMLACQNGKSKLVKALELLNCSIFDTNKKGENVIHLMVKGKRIKNYNRNLLKYLISKGVDINAQYEEQEYVAFREEYELKKDENTTGANESLIYKCTPIIHLIRTEHMEVWDKGDKLDDIFEQTHLRINPNQTDSDGKDMFMHMAILNEFELTKYVVACVSKNYQISKAPAETEEPKLVEEIKGEVIEKQKLTTDKGQSIKEAKKAPQIVKPAPKQEYEEEMIITEKDEIRRQEKIEKQLMNQVNQIEGSDGDSSDEDMPEEKKEEVKEEKKETYVPKTKYGINLERRDNTGKTVIHYIITPITYGSYENEDFLEYMLKFGFRGDLTDNDNMKAHDYAAQQSSGTMLNILKEYKIAPNDLEVEDIMNKYKKIEDWSKIDYLKDAQDFLDLVKMNMDNEKLVPCDPAGKFNDDCIVHQDEENIYDCHLTRVDIGRDERDDYLFYKLQVVYDKGRDLWILFTRWGRIGEVGAFQKTPYPKEECIEQFKSIFLSKTKNEWKDRANFKKHWWKYQLTNVNYSNVAHQDYLVPFDFTKSKASRLHPSVQEIMREITQVTMYVKGIKNQGIDINQMPFSNINRKDLLQARKSLTKLREILEELEPIEARFNRFSKEGKDKIVALREKMWYHSSRFYEMVPHEQFKNEIVPPINKMSILKEKAEMIDNLINFEMGSKILLGAHKNSSDVNPLDYCMDAMGVEISEMDKASEEFNILKDYCVRTWPEDKNASKKIRNIFKIQRKGEGENFEEYNNLSNKFLLFHGSRISNFMGIMSQGLRVAPPEAPKTGYMFGKGVYFADMLQKSVNYCNDNNGEANGSKFMLLCEVAVGKSHKLTHAQYMDEPPAGYDSVQGLGQRGPCYAKCFAFPEGYKVPRGKYLEYEYDQKIQDRVYLRHNEFIIYKTEKEKMRMQNNESSSESNPGQIKMRYLIQIK